MKANIMLVAAAAAAFAIAVFIVASLPTPLAVLPMVSPPPNNIAPVTPGYLDDTKIYLVSENASYGTYPENLQQQFTNITVIHQGDPCLLLNLTLRNDYADNDTFPNRWGDNGGQNFGAAYMMLNMAFFDEAGAQLNATNITHASVPFTNRDAFSIHNGGTEALCWVFSVPSQTVDHINMTLGYLGPLPVP